MSSDPSAKRALQRAHNDNAANEDTYGTGGVGGEEDQSPVSQSPSMHNGVVASRHSEACLETSASAGSLPGSAARGKGRREQRQFPLQLAATGAELHYRQRLQIRLAVTVSMTKIS